VLLEAGALPRTSSGKLRRRAALARYLDGGLEAAGDRGALARWRQRLGARPEVQAARALVRSARLRRAATDPPEGGAATRGQEREGEQAGREEAETGS
jgi:hypothetical protein